MSLYESDGRTRPVSTPASCECCPLAARGLEELDRVPVGVLDLDLPPAGTGLHFVPEAHSRVLQRVDEGRQVGDLQHNAVPAAGLLAAPVRHGTRSRRARTAEQQLGVAERDA